MRIVIDMQGAQGSNKQRGIGRYTISLAQSIVSNRGNNEVLLALNGLFPESIETIRSVFNDHLPQENIRVWQAPGPVCGSNNKNDQRRLSAELVREAFLISLKPDVVVVSSLFEGPDNDTVTSIGMFNNTIPTVVILYDLIPLIHPLPYLENPVVENWYENKLEHLRRADLLLAISESSRQEGIHYLHFSPEKCINISTAADKKFKPMEISFERENDISEHYGLFKPFVMYTGGIDHRKNVEGLIRAYSNLSKTIRANHQLVIVCANLMPNSRVALETLAKEQGLVSGEMVLVGFVSEEDLVVLYNLCKVFVFPSLYEGFGIPALEAMSCGTAVIGSNSTSLPEVIGREDALFDPTNDDKITEKITKVLTDEVFLSELEHHALKQAKQFSWDVSAMRAISALEKLHEKKISHKPAGVLATNRPKLAYVSPLPPVRSGISDYSAELLPYLSKYYDIDVVVEQEPVSDLWIKDNCTLRSVEWLMNNASTYDRVLYHFGNNYFHQHMFPLLKKVPGIVVLHDFFLSGVVGHLHFSGQESTSWIKSLYQNHGFPALLQHFDVLKTAEVPWFYPCNLGVLQDSLGVVVHSENSRKLAKEWYGENAVDDWTVIPLLRITAPDINRTEARSILNLNKNDFVICSFGLLGPTKLNHRLLDAWLASRLSTNTNCVLVFVGENHNGEYGKELVSKINSSGLSKRILITGWVDSATFRNYLAAADAGVQLRALSRGETSATVLDCMNYGLATIVNANGSMADLLDDSVLKLEDLFNDGELVCALETLWKNDEQRQRLGRRAKEIISTHHDPKNCAAQYREVIEKTYKEEKTNIASLTRALSCIESQFVDPKSLIALAESIALSIPSKYTPRQLLVDISELVLRDSKSGIQRVVRSVLSELLKHPPEGYRIEPIYATTDQEGYQYARCFTSRFIGCPESILTDEPIEFKAGDIFLGLDLQQQVVIVNRNFYQHLRNFGVQVLFLVYDLLPVILPKAFSVDAEKHHHSWLEVVTESDGVVCISRSVANELTEWHQKHGPERLRPFKINWFHLGADVENSVPTYGLPSDAENTLKVLASRPTFLTVGTLEPRKGQAQVLSVFELLWEQGKEINLVIVGKQGWMVEALIKRLLKHPERNKRLFWLESISDEYLDKIYSLSTCLIFASEGEGFGLPLIEAARHNLPIIARDISVFKEVAGAHAFYFNGLEPIDLYTAIQAWIVMSNKDEAPQSSDMPWLTWRQSVQQLLNIIIPNKDRDGKDIKINNINTPIKINDKKIYYKNNYDNSTLKKIINKSKIVILRSRFKKPLKKIYYALKLNKIL